MGIILPVSILQNNDNLYAKAREILIRDFDIKAIFELGSAAFMATGTNTIALFTKRAKNDFEALRPHIKDFFIKLNDISLAGYENAISLYLNHTREKLSLENYIKKIKSYDKCQEDIKEKIRDKKEKLSHESLFEFEFDKKELKKELSELENELKIAKESKERFLLKEEKRILYFLRSLKNELFIFNMPKDKKTNSKILGFEFSNRRGSEGLKRLGDGLLMDKKGLNENKLNFYVRAAFLGEFKEPSNELKKYLFKARLSSLLSWENEDNFTAIKLLKKKSIKSEFELVRLGEYISFSSGQRPKGGITLLEHGAISLGGEQISRDGFITLEKKPFVPFDFYEKKPNSHIKEGDILLCKDGALTGKVALARKSDFIQKELMVNEHVFLLRSISKALRQDFLFFCLFTKIMYDEIQAVSQKSAQPGLNTDSLINLKIPLPPLEVQARLAKKMQAEYALIEKANKQIKESEEKIKAVDLKNAPIEKLGNFINFVIGGTPSRKEIKYYTNANNLWVSIAEMNSNCIIDTKEKINDLGVRDSNVKLLEKGTILLSFKLSIGKTAIAGKNLYTNEAIAGLVLKNNANLKLNYRYLYQILTYKLVDLKSLIKDNTFGATLNSQTMPLIPIPLPPLKDQAKIVEKIQGFEKEIEKAKDEIKAAKNRQKKLMQTCFNIE